MDTLNKIATEQRNPRTLHIDEVSTLDMVKLINSEDRTVAESIVPVLPKIAEAIDVIADRISRGGRLVYTGCGTSGRLGVLDASECPPTFSADADTVRAVIAGGPNAVFNAAEGAEDDPEQGAKDIAEIGLSAADVLCGIAASGRTPYVIGAMKYAKSVGAAVIAVTCCPGSEIDRLAGIGISPAPGPEVITGSTRMKSGTAQKMVLNMLSTGAMIKLGKVYGNLMVDVRPSNEKLILRCRRIVREATGVDEEQATKALEACGYRCKTAVVMLLKGVDSAEADRLLGLSGGRVAEAIKK